MYWKYIEDEVSAPQAKNVRRRQGEVFKHALDAVVRVLQRNESLATSARAHLLQGKWRGCWECHVENDWLLIYTLTDTDLILVRTGTHADLFE